MTNMRSNLVSAGPEGLDYWEYFNFYMVEHANINTKFERNPGKRRKIGF